ncbi:hypothetical protein F7R13_21555 [Burkholderia territorii]|uniref:Uncharacterized protein n=1 Tax=Burkholderia territorii TaxID=1503055 RepID=A0A6L3NDQ1_9BURK|nr:hypothetical protein [Burkholderia territorii]KAB0662435.1 hypothetical protein F7R13_21555 [Burkholderia territorii]
MKNVPWRRARGRPAVARFFTTGRGIFYVPYKEQRASDGMEYRGVAGSIKNKFIGPDALADDPQQRAGNPEKWT